MQLEAGKKYKTRDGSVAECIAVWTRDVDGYQATVLLGDCHVEYTLNGCFWNKNTTVPFQKDIVSEYKKPVKYKAWLILDDEGYASVVYTEQNVKDLVNTKDEVRAIEWEVK